MEGALAFRGSVHINKVLPVDISQVIVTLSPGQTG